MAARKSLIGILFEVSAVKRARELRTDVLIARRRQATLDDAIIKVRRKTEALDFEALLYRFACKTFEEPWERKLLHLSRGDPHHRHSILTKGDLHDFTSHAHLNYPAI
jgi:hypothetical protein